MSSVCLQIGDVTVSVPEKQLRYKSVAVEASGKQFSDWSEKDHTDSYEWMRRIAEVWKESCFAKQYLIYGKISASNPFRWEVIPYQKCRTCLGRIVQQLQVLWRVVFGGITTSEESHRNQVAQYQLGLCSASGEAAKVSRRSDDAFCKEETIKRQWVIEGKKVNVLFNYAPIGFGGERLHFLVVPIEHRETFTEVTKEEYSESLELTAALVDQIQKTREIKNVYLLNKTGIDAGQSVKHWHLHVIFTTNPAQDIWGKLTVVKNILFGSSPMKEAALQETVSRLRRELTP